MRRSIQEILDHADELAQRSKTTNQPKATNNPSRSTYSSVPWGALGASARSSTLLLQRALPGTPRPKFGELLDTSAQQRFGAVIDQV